MHNLHSIQHKQNYYKKVVQHNKMYRVYVLSMNNTMLLEFLYFQLKSDTTQIRINRSLICPDYLMGLTLYEKTSIRGIKK